MWFTQCMIIAGLLFSACTKESSAPAPQLIFDSIPQSVVLNPLITETSGIADSRSNPGHLWGIEDSGNPPELFLLNHNGSLVKRIFVEGASNRDWEDMVLAGNEIYIGEVGDNNSVNTESLIYRLPEPEPGDDTITVSQIIRFRYHDGPRDVEAFLVDPVTKDIFLISKRQNPSRVYKLAFPYDGTQVHTATFTGQMQFGGVTSAALSDDGRQILIKTYTGLYFFEREPGESINEVLEGTARLIPHKLEPQGEAISFAIDDSGYFSLSEKGFSSTVQLYFYERK